MLQNITKCYKKCYKSKFVTLLIVLYLCGCAKKQPSTAIAENIKSDITVIEQQVEDVKQNLSPECKTPVIMSNLNVIEKNVDNLKAKVESLDSVCLNQQEGLKQENAKLKWIIGFMVILCGGFIVLILKNHKIL